MPQEKNNRSSVDKNVYRRARLWQIIMVSCSAFIGMAFYSLTGMASYTQHHKLKHRCYTFELSRLKLYYNSAN